MGKQFNAIMEALSPNQQTAAETIDRDVLVRAGAGSGKTKTLVARYLHLLDENRTWSPADITAVTFTRKAAREMQNRIRNQMMALAYQSENDPEEKQFWLQRLNEMDSANIGTIHNLCGRILRAHPAEAGLDPAFSVLEDNDAAVMTGQIVEEIISQISSDPEFDALLNFYSTNKLANILSGMLKSRGKTDLALSVPGTKTEIYMKRKVKEVILDSKYSGIIEEYREMAAAPDFDKNAGVLAERIKDLIASYGRGLDMLETGCHPADAVFHIYSVFNGGNFSQGNKQIMAAAQQFRDEIKTDFPFLKKDSKNPYRDIEWYKDHWNKCDKADESLRKLWIQVRNQYMKNLDSLQTIDFDAMESLTLDLLRTHPEIRQLWTEKIKALLVDEFQDTNEAQAELFTLLNPTHNRLFAVGDKKQSIYGFRGTNVALFENRGKDVRLHNGKDILLDTTYRTIPELLGPMGCLLETVMDDAELSGREYYADYEPMKSGKKEDPLPKNQPRIELLLGDIQQKEDDPDGKIIGSMLADRLTELMKTGKLHNWNDAAVLCRSTNDFKQFENAFEEWHIPYVTVAGKGYYDRPEIRDILNILRTAENPHDNAAFTGFLLSPCIGFTAEMTVRVFQFANKGGLKLSFWQAMSDEEFSFENKEKQEKLERARSILSELIRLSGQAPLDQVLEEAYRLTGIRTLLALDSGDRAWLNLDKLLLAARESKRTSVSEFLEYLEKIKETGAREGEAPSDNIGAIRIMTIHQAKGLEFPVTILCNDEFSFPKAPGFVSDTDGTYVFYSSPAHPRFADAKKSASDKDKAEWLRLFYVAVTRAKERLILCGKKPEKLDGSTDSWLIRMLRPLSQECMVPGEYIGPAWGAEGQAVFIRCSNLLPIAPTETQSTFANSMVNDDFSLLDPLPFKNKEPRKEEHKAAATVEKLVHKGLELWRFPDEKQDDPVLTEAFRKILFQADSLNSEEQRSVHEKAVMLLSRFKDSDTFHLIESTSERWHEIPFSFPAGVITVNGMIDMLLKDESGNYTVIDFKTDELKSMNDLINAENEHKKQLEKYRKALNVTLGADPVCKICFLDCCGKVELVTVGKDHTEWIEAVNDLNEWIQEEDSDDYLFEEEQGLLLKTTQYFDPL